MQTIAGKVKQILVQQLGVDDEEVTAEASIVNDLGADSLDLIEIVMACEDEFSIEIPDEDAEKVKTVDDIVRYVGERLTAKK